MTRFKYLAVVNIVFIKEGKILLARRMGTGYCDGFYEVPSGHMDGNETVTMAAVREAKEEVGVIIKPEDLKVVHVMHRFGENERIEFFLVTNKWEGEPKIAEPDKCDDLSWQPLSNLPDNMIPKTKFGIEQYMKGNHFSEFDWK